RLELLVQPLPRRLFTLAQRVFALVYPGLGGAQRLTLPGREALIVLERAQVAVDLREVLGELRLARRQVLARRGDDRRVQAEPPRHLEREAAPRAAVEQLIGRREGVGV